MTSADHARLRKLAHTHIDQIIDALPAMSDMRYSPNVARPDRVGARAIGTHSDPTASSAIARVAGTNEAAAWLNDVGAALTALARLHDEIAGQSEIR